MDATRIVSGVIRHLTGIEKLTYPMYKYVTTTEFSYTNGDDNVIVPAGFLTDGSSGGPDYGCSWLFHDYLYATHCFAGGIPCTRKQADKVMETVLRNERLTVYCWVFSRLAKINPFWLFSKAWTSSGIRGADVALFKKDI